jgi:hypothetical protein
MISKLVFSRIHCLIALARLGGIKALFGDIMYQLKSTNVYLRLEKDLTKDDPDISCGIEYQISPGTKNEIESIFQGIKNEYKKTAIELITRKRLYDFGFHKYYLAREQETQKPCFLAWIISANEAGADSAKSRFLQQYFTALKPDELLIEGSLAFYQFRGKNVSPSVTVGLAKLARSQGYRRMITFVQKDNIPALKCCEKIGFKQCSVVNERRFLFSNKRSIIEKE